MNKVIRYYAIKCGKNVKDIIVTSWEECSKYVLGCEAIYQSFDNRREAKRYLCDISDEHVKLQLEARKLCQKKREMNKIQSMFDFKIPEYILDEILKIKNKKIKDYKDLYICIGIATMGGTITKSQARILKKEIK